MSAATRATVGACSLGVGLGWCVSNTGAVAARLAADYGVGLAAVGLLTTGLFVAHLALQLPAGRLSDRFGARRVGLAGLLLVAACNGIALAAPSYPLALAARTLTGIGTGLGFVAGSDYVRSAGGSALAQGLYGGIGLGGGGLALLAVPPLEGAVGWRAPYASALAVALLALPPLLAGPRRRGRPRRPLEARASALDLLRDARLQRFAVAHSAGFGLSVVAGNWVVTLLDRHGASRGAAGAVGALTLLLGVVSRPAGGWIARGRRHLLRGALAASFLAGAAGCLVLAGTPPLAAAAVGALLVGAASGIPFAPAFAGAALARPEAPAAAVGLVNAAGSVVVLAMTPLVGLTFSLPGDGRIGFAVLAALWAGALLGLPRERAPAAAPSTM